MTIKERINRLKGNKNTPEENLVKLMEYFHWTLEDIEHMKVPQYYTLMDILNTLDKKKPKGKKGK